MRKRFKMLLLLICISFLFGCSKQIMFATTNDRSYWDIYDIVSGIDGRYKIGISKNIKYLVLSIQIDRLSPNKKKENCKEAFDLNFGTVIKKENLENIQNYLKTNQILFDTSKIFIIKNNKKYKINLQKRSLEVEKLINEGKILIDPIYKNNSSLKGEDEILNLSNIFLQKIYRENQDKDFFTIGTSLRYNLQFGCQALEGTTILIEGLSINNEQLPSIVIELSYKKQSTHKEQDDFIKLKISKI